MTDDEERIITKFEKGYRVLEKLRQERYPFIPPEIFFSLEFVLNSTMKPDLSMELNHGSEALEDEILRGLNNWYALAQDHTDEIVKHFSWRMKELRKYIEIKGSGPLGDDTIFVPDDRI